MAQLSENIRALRMQLGLSQVEFARRFAITKQCVSNWENGNVMLSVEMLVRMADFFRVSTDYLLGRADRQSIDVSELTDEQCAHIRLIVQDLRVASSQSAAFA